MKIKDWYSYKIWDLEMYEGRLQRKPLCHGPHIKHRQDLKMMMRMKAKQEIKGSTRKEKKKSKRMRRRRVGPNGLKG